MTIPPTPQLRCHGCYQPIDGPNLPTDHGAFHYDLVCLVQWINRQEVAA